LRCAVGRIRYADGTVKEYGSRQPLRTPSTRTDECPDYQPMTADDLFADIRAVIEYCDR
jgi:hypothetical protein